MAVTRTAGDNAPTVAPEEPGEGLASTEPAAVPRVAPADETRVAARTDAIAPQTESADSGLAPSDRIEDAVAPVAEVSSPPTVPAPVAPTAIPDAQSPAAAPTVTGGEVKRSPAPGYPRKARLRGVEGQVTVRYAVDTRGRVSDVEVLSARPEGVFDKAVVKAVRKWRHEPFLAEGEKVVGSVTRTFDFGIRREEIDAETQAAACRKVTGSRICRSGKGYQELGVVVVHNPL